MDLLFLFKCLHGQYELHVSDYLQFYELKHDSYNLRNTEVMFKSIYAGTDTFKYSFFFSLELYDHGISYLYLLKW